MLQQALCLEERLSALVAHRVICVNHPQRDTLVARGIPRSQDVHLDERAGPADLRAAAGATAVDAGAGERFNLVYHGTMAERLGVDLIIRAVARLHGPHPRPAPAPVGPRRRSAQASSSWRRELGVEDRVLFKPKGYPLQELPSRLATMDLGVVGNRRSAAGDLMLPVKLMEYVSLGIPAVVPRLRTIEHYFSDDMVGLLRTGRRAVAGGRDLPRSTASRTRRRGRPSSAAAFLDEYGWERQGAELVNLYQQLVEN